MYRTSYNDMSGRVKIQNKFQLPKLINTHYLPKYGGTVPGMKSENPFGSNFTKAGKEKIIEFNKKRFQIGSRDDYKE